MANAIMTSQLVSLDDEMNKSTSIYRRAFFADIHNIGIFGFRRFPRSKWFTQQYDKV